MHTQTLMRGDLTLRGESLDIIGSVGQGRGRAFHTVQRHDVTAVRLARGGGRGAGLLLLPFFLVFLLPMFMPLILLTDLWPVFEIPEWVWMNMTWITMGCTFGFMVPILVLSRLAARTGVAIERSDGTVITTKRRGIRHAMIALHGLQAAGFGAGGE